MLDNVCPGCGVSFPPYEGATHRYIGANAACWAIYTAINVGAEPDAALIAGSVVPASPTTGTAVDRLAAMLFVDAYAAQHHGTASPQAMQSVAVHLLALHGIFRRDKSPTDALWIRNRALRQRGVFTWLTPPPAGTSLTLRHLYPGGGVKQPCSQADYVRSVYEAWDASHAGRLAEWYDRFVVPDA